MFGIFPAVSMRIDIGLGCLSKGDLGGLLSLQKTLSLLALCNGVVAVDDLIPGLTCFFAGLCKWHCGVGAQTHVPALACNHGSQHP